MKIWFPYIRAGTGSDVFTKVLSQGLKARGHDVCVACFDHAWQYLPWRLRLVPAPPGTDLVLANSWNAFAFGRPGARLVVVEHLFVLDPALGPYRSPAQAIFHHTLVRHFVTRSYRNADRVIALSRYARERMTDAFPWLRPDVIPNGIDTDFFTPAPEGKAPLRGRAVRLLFVGNPSRRKGADLLPELMRRLGPGFELRYTTGVREEDPFRAVPGMVSLGRLDREGARTAYRQADLFVFPSRLEGLPLVVMEAMACGTPAIVSDASSLPEMVQDGIDGRVCATDDVAAMAEAITATVADPLALPHMGVAARARAERAFASERMVRDYEQLFEALLDGPRLGPAPGRA